MTPSPRPGKLGRLVLGCQPDSRLVALVREGSDRAFEEIVGRYRRRLVAYAAGLVRPDRAEDVVQESLVRAIVAIRGGDADISLRPWLFTIVRNRALNDRRDEPAHERLDEHYDGVPQPPEIASRREELASVVDRVKALPEAQREALVQRELEGRSHEEIAVALTVTPGAVRGLIFRARSTLRNAAGLLVPLPVLRALLDSPEVGGGAVAAGAAAGAGGLFKLGTTFTVVAAVAVGSGVALHDPGRNSNEATAMGGPDITKPSKGRTRSGKSLTSTAASLRGPGSAAAGPGEGSEPTRGESGSSGPGPSGSEGGGDRSSSSGPSPSDDGGGTGSGASGSDGSGSSSGADDGGSGGGGSDATSGSSGPGGGDLSSGGGSGDGGSGSDDTTAATATSDGGSGSGDAIVDSSSGETTTESSGSGSGSGDTSGDGGDTTTTAEGDGA